MKKSKLILFAAALMLVATACVEEIEENSGEEVVTLKIEGGTKVTVDNGNGTNSGTLNWASGDQISVAHSLDTKTPEEGQEYYWRSYEVDATTSKVTIKTSYYGPRAFYAIYPASLDPGVDERYPTILYVSRMPSSYNYSQVAGINAPIPMISANESGQPLVFYQLGALLRLKISNVPDYTRSLVVDFYDSWGLGRQKMRVSGRFVIGNPNPGTSTISSSTTTNSSEASITITNIAASDIVNGELTVSIPLPIGAYGSIDVAARRNADGTNAGLQNSFQINTTSALNARKGGLKKSITLP